MKFPKNIHRLNTWHYFPQHRQFVTCSVKPTVAYVNFGISFVVIMHRLHCGREGNALCLGVGLARQCKEVSRHPSELHKFQLLLMRLALRNLKHTWISVSNIQTESVEKTGNEQHCYVRYRVPLTTSVLLVRVVQPNYWTSLRKPTQGD